mgnify:FL=1
MLGKAKRALTVALAVFLVAAALVTAVVAVPQVAGGDESFVVVSGSMSPTIEAGDIVVVDEASPSDIEEGDIITFDRTPGDDKRTMHRVVGVVSQNDRRYFRTKGDANEEADPQLVPADAVIGTVQFSIPYVGWAYSFASTDTGTLLFVAVPGVLLAASELWALIAAARATNEPDR